MEECKLANLSHPHMRRVVDSTKLTHCNSQSESLPDSMNCLSSASLDEKVKTESVIVKTDYTGVEPQARLISSDDIEERTESLYEMTQEEKDRRSNMKEEVEEWEERQSVKIEREDGVRDPEGLRSKPRKASDEQKGKGVTDLTCQTQEFEKNGVKSEYCQQDMEEESNQVTACLLKQPRVLIRRLKISGNSVPESPHPHPFARKEDQGVRSQQKWHKLSPMKGKCSLRQKDQVMTCNREIIGHLVRPQKHLSTSSENG